MTSFEGGNRIFFLIIIEAMLRHFPPTLPITLTVPEHQSDISFGIMDLNT